MSGEEQCIRQDIVEQSRALVALGLVSGTSGNISVRSGEAMLITPSAVRPERLSGEMVVRVALSCGPVAGGPKPSSEWRFHRDILVARPEVGAVVHTHSPYATALAMARRDIPAAHYMVALFGGSEVRCARYATFGTQALSEAALEALEGRTACLLANHGAIALGRDLAEAMDRAVELEALARQYCIALSIGGPVLLDGPEMVEAQAAFAGYRPHLPQTTQPSASTLFDAVLIVDWSAASVPKTGRDSIWWALHRVGKGEVERANPATRAEAMAEIEALLAAELTAGRRVLAGFDFPFGYPAGVAARLSGEPGWQPLWARLADALPSRPDNRTERFAVAAELNAAWDAEGPFWGNASAQDHPGLPRKKPAGWGVALPREWRLVERLQRAAPGANPKSVWQLAGAGSVGSQALTGIACLERLRQSPQLSGAVEVWPFETGLAPPTKPLCIAEVYPSLVPVNPQPGEVRDAAQVSALARHFATLDAKGLLAPLFRADALTNLADRAAVETEEAWILGVGV